MEFTKENVIRLLNDVSSTIRKLATDNELKMEEFEGERGLYDYFQGKTQALNSTADYIDDTINFVDKFLLTTEDLIDKEKSNA